MTTALPAHLLQEGGSAGCQPSFWLGSLVAPPPKHPAPPLPSPGRALKSTLQ